MSTAGAGQLLPTLVWDKVLAVSARGGVLVVGGIGEGRSVGDGRSIGGRMSVLLCR